MSEIALKPVALLPINEVPERFSAAVLWNFRTASLGIQTVLWTTIGVLFGGAPSAGWLIIAMADR